MSPRYRIGRRLGRSGKRHVILEHDRAVQLRDPRDEPEVPVLPPFATGLRRGIERGPVHLDAVGQRLQELLVVERLRIHRAAP
jgi:hypothetical protein